MAAICEMRLRGRRFAVASRRRSGFGRRTGLARAHLAESWGREQGGTPIGMIEVDGGGSGLAELLRRAETGEFDAIVLADTAGGLRYHPWAEGELRRRGIEVVVPGTPQARPFTQWLARRATSGAGSASSESLKVSPTTLISAER